MRHVLFLVTVCFLCAAGAASSRAQGDGRYDTEKPVSTDEYKDVKDNLMVPKEEPADGESHPGSSISVGHKLTYETIEKNYRQGSYEGLVQALEPLANGGHHGAEELLGVMYRLGQGADKNLTKAFGYLSKAAEQGRALAEHHIGLMYFNGESIDADPVMGLAWLHIAIVHYADGPDKERAKQDRDKMYGSTTRREKDRALQYARDWLNKHGEGHLLDLSQ